MPESYTLYQEYLNEWVTRYHGLPSHQIHDLLFCNRKLWLATPNGLAIFDGETMLVMDQKQGLLTHGFRRLAIDGDYILASSDKGLDRINSHNLALIDQYSSVENGLGWCQAAAAIGEDKYLLACAKGLRIWDIKHNKLRKLNSPLDNEFIVNLVGFERHTVLIHANSTGLWLYSNGEIKPFSPDVLELYGEIKNIIQDQSFIWLVTSQSILQLDPDFHMISAISIPESIKNIRALKLINNSELFIANDERLVVLSKQEQQWKTMRIVHEDILINAFCSDQFNNLWAASDFSGLLKVSALHQLIRSFRTQRKNSILSIQPKKSNQQSSKTIALLQDSKKGLLVGGTGNSFFVSEETPEAAEEIIGLRNLVCWDIQFFERLGYWAASNKGLVHFQKFSQAMPSNYTEQQVGAGRCLAEFNGDIIYGSVSGLFFFDVPRRKFKPILDDLNRSLGYIYAIKPIESECFYLCTLGNGIWHYNAARSVLERVFINISKDNVYAIDINSAGQIVLAADNQIWLIDNQQCEMVYEVNESVAAWSCIWYTEAKILLGTSLGLKVLNLSDKQIEFVLDTFPKEKFWEFTTTRSLIKSSNGGYWCGLNEGLQLVDLASLETMVPQPTPEIKNIQCNKAFELSSGKVTLQQGVWTLQVQIGCFWFWHEHSLKYSYRVSGLHASWRQLDGVTFSLTTLPAGKYIVEVKVLNTLTQSNKEHQLLLIEVLNKNWALKIIDSVLKKLNNLVHKILSFKSLANLQQEYLKMEIMVEHRTNELRISNQKLLELNKSLKSLSNRDQLTELYNRRYFFEQFDKEIKRTLRDKTAVSVLMIDVDYFKNYNDHYGHLAGDICLKSIAKTLDGCLHRSGDLVARYGGEEFIALLHNSSNKTAMDMGKHIVAAISRLKIEHRHSECSPYITISVGITTDLPVYEPDEDNLEKYRKKLISEADKALYIAKSQGRDQACNYAVETD